MSCFSTYGIGGASVWENAIVINNTEAVFDYFNVDTWNNSLSCCRDPAVFPTTNLVENVKVDKDLLLLNVVPKGRSTTSSSVSSKESDILYGSFRFDVKVPNTPGTASGLFFFHSITEEIDMEFLSHESHIRLAIQPILRNITTGEASSLSQAKVTNMNKNEFKEYRFDWYSGRVDFYINSVYYNTLSYNVPNLPGKIIINHRSNGNPKWSRGPPVNTSSLVIRRISLYYNTSTSVACNKITIVETKKEGFSFKKYGTIIIISCVLFLLGLSGGFLYFLPKKVQEAVQEVVDSSVPEDAVQQMVELQEMATRKPKKVTFDPAIYNSSNLLEALKDEGIPEAVETDQEQAQFDVLEALQEFINLRKSTVAT